MKVGTRVVVFKKGSDWTNGRFGYGVVTQSDKSQEDCSYHGSAYYPIVYTVKCDDGKIIDSNDRLNEFVEVDDAKYGLDNYIELARKNLGKLLDIRNELNNT